MVAGTNFRLVLKIRRKTGPGCSENLEQVKLDLDALITWSRWFISPALAS